MRGASAGMMITLGTPNCRAARATPCAWLPEEKAITPRARVPSSSAETAARAAILEAAGVLPRFELDVQARVRTEHLTGDVVRPRPRRGRAHRVSQLGPCASNRLQRGSLDVHRESCTLGPVRLHAPAAERNALPILEVLRTFVPERGTLLEIASGTGQHVSTFAPAFPNLTFQPTEFDTSKFESIRAWTSELANVREPLGLDVTADVWPVQAFDAVFCANMIHIAPQQALEGLLLGVGRHLAQGGPLGLYGPFKIDGRHTAPSNEAFDASLRARDPRWGVRDLETVIALADAQGLSFERRIEMPANNQIVLFRRTAVQ